MYIALTVSIVAMTASLAALFYALRVRRRVRQQSRMSSADRVCAAWNGAHPIGTWITVDSPLSVAGAARRTVRTLGYAHVRAGTPVLDVEDLGTIPLNGQVHTIQ